MKQGKRCLPLAVILAALLTLGVCADYEAKEATNFAEDYTGKTVILHTGDVHGAVEGYARITALDDFFTSLGAETILVDTGDFSAGTAYVSASRGKSAVDLMNEAGYNFAVPGEHEFDYGLDQFRDNLESADFTALCANIWKDETPLFAPNAVYTTASGVQIGFFGLTAPEIRTEANPNGVHGLTILGGDDLFVHAQEQIDALREMEADVVVALCSLGVDQASAGNQSMDVYAQTSGIDVLLDGRSHTVMTAGENGEPIQSAGANFAYVGAVVIDDATRTIKDRFLIPTENLDQDPAVTAAVAALVEQVDAENGGGGAVSGTSRTASGLLADDAAAAPDEFDAAPAPTQTAPSTYTVVSGDTLWIVSQKVYGIGRRWDEIYEANRDLIRDPDEIFAGQVLKIV